MQHAHALRAFACNLRGQFLEGTAWLEVLLTDILAQYFCSDRRRRMFFFSEVANSMSFRSKAGLLDKIISYEFPEFHGAYPKLKKRLDEFRQFRNMLAHDHIDTSDAELSAKPSGEVTFLQYKRGQLKRVRITEEDAQQRADNANKLKKELLAIQTRLFHANPATENSAGD